MGDRERDGNVMQECGGELKKKQGENNSHSRSREREAEMEKKMTMTLKNVLITCPAFKESPPKSKKDATTL